MQSPDTVRLSLCSRFGGCASKVGAPDLARVLAGVRFPTDPRLLVGLTTSDDAGVYQLTRDLAIVQTVDFFTPIVDDPFDFGRIAATNALSDVYAMGGTPVSALNLVAFSLEQLGSEPLVEILRGGATIAKEAGVAIIGGHSIDDPEPKYGLAVVGVVHPDELLTNATARSGDVLVLTKPLGAGTVSTAIKRGLEAPVAEAIEVMTTLKPRACRPRSRLIGSPRSTALSSSWKTRTSVRSRAARGATAPTQRRSRVLKRPSRPRGAGSSAMR
jgi:selenide,water dikinase